MQVFDNPAGSGSLWFDNLATADGTAVAYDPQARAFLPMGPFCANRDRIGCNWLAPAQGEFCRSCKMTELAPDPTIDNAIVQWAKTEAAKRWVLDNLGQWHWFRPEDTGPPPMFNMLAEYDGPAPMGHANGVVTISVAEADHVIRTERREMLGERYRTMIGHMRHEIAHMLWWRLSARADFLEAFRSMFGDEREDYGEALQRHYQNGPAPDWQEHFLTRYASAHPHEDWAETTAHLLHLTDITDSFISAGMSADVLPKQGWNPYRETDSKKLIYVGASIAVGVNHVNRAMGLSDIYPFLMAGPTHEKLAFVHEWLRRGVRAG